jgi:hypothetical protein
MWQKFVPTYLCAITILVFLGGIVKKEKKKLKLDMRNNFAVSHTKHHWS